MNQLNSTGGRAFHLPDMVKDRPDFPAMNRVRIVPSAAERDRLCGCGVPLVLDPESGSWLHLATMSRCPER
jgi:hypothetical protein